MEGDVFSGFGERHNMDGKLLQSFQKSFVDVQDILDQNRLLINEINQNHESKQPDNLGRNVGLIKELNNNIRRVASLYGDLSHSFARSMDASSEGESSGTLKSDGKANQKRFRSASLSGENFELGIFSGKLSDTLVTVFSAVFDYGEMFQDAVAHTSGASLSSENQIENPVVYKLVRVAQDGRLVPATDEEMLEVKDLVENNENDMSVVPDPGQYEYITNEGSPSQFLQLDSLEGLFQSETAEAYTDNLNSRLEVCPPPLELLQSKEELVYGSQMPFPLLDTNYHSSNELPGDEEFVLSEVLLQEPVCFSSDGCGIDQPMDVSPYSNAAGGSPKAPAVSTTASSPGASRDTEEICLGNLSIKALQDTFRATFGRETTCKDKLWLQRKIKMGRVNPCVIPTTSQTVNDNKLILGGQDNCNDTSVDEGRASNCKGTPSSPNDFVKGHPNDFEYSPVEAFVDHYSGNEDFEGEYRSAKRVRKATRRYIEEISKVDDEKQESKESLIPSKDERSISTVSSGRRVVVTRMVSLGGSIIQVPYVSHVRRSRPRENIMALGEFHSKSWEVKAMPEESNLSVSQSQLNSDVKRVSGVKSVSGPDQKKLTTHRQSYKDHSKPEVDEDIMEPEYMDSSGDSSDDSSYNRVDRPVTQSAMRRKHHRAWCLSEVKNLVEGVSKYGVGKWSVIKRLSYSSFPHRTPVDLKDKWRNLLKACFARAPLNKMGSMRKYGSMAIPSEVLSEVRELAQKKSHVSPARKARMALIPKVAFVVKPAYKPVYGTTVF
ncbi:BnaC05g13570D [Brassica napus]|uniref:BnaC05g13570D protein n=1 Tax=Brassica napus TaxID=3708 RepID=A0A078IGK9_BRANA|nr:BnaC05g13570D [Brassica napus]